MTVTISQLISYPIKSCAGVSLKRTQINEMGLAGDRQLMLVDEDGLFLSQRKHPSMALIKPQFAETGLIINAPGMNPLTVDLDQHSDQPSNVTIWQDSFQANMFPQTTNQWFSDYLKKPVNLVKYGQLSHRPIDPDYAFTGETVAFADGYPLLVTHQATLDQVNQHLNKPIGMDRFRPNIVLNSDLEAWDELNWNCISALHFQIELVKPCTRCVMTGVEQTTGEQTGTEVLMTLKQRFAHQNKAVFGVNGIAKNLKSGEIKIGQNLNLD